MSDIEIEIDGKLCQAKPNAMVIEVADAEGIYIPRFCYHKRLSIAANCRMCLVEVEKSPKTLPACATPVMPGMKVFTRSPKALAAQKAVMEFLLLNHPLDCPVCDQGGECELQDLSMGYGSSDSLFKEGKRAVHDQDIGPLIETFMTRCIQCTRCVRFGAEIAGMRELGAVNRGEDMEISTYVEHAMKSEVSGNVIDICPVGALTSKPFRYRARAWELEQRPTVSPHDCIGTNLNAHLRNGKVMRMVPRENANINDVWISDRDRYSYEGLYHADRVTKPRIKKKGIWHEVDWQTALEFAVGSIQKILSENALEQFGALASPSSTVEEFYLLQKMMRALGSSNVDHRLRQVDFIDQESLASFPGLGMSIAELEQCDSIFLIGSNIQKEQPSAFLRVRKAFLKGAKITALNMFDYPFGFDVIQNQIVSPDEMVSSLARITHAFVHNTKISVSRDMQDILDIHAPKESDFALAAALQENKKSIFILGNAALNHPEASAIRKLARVLAELSGAQIGCLTEGANAAGAWLAGAIPHRGVAATDLKNAGLNAQEMIQDHLKAYLLLNVEPNVDCADPVAAITALHKAEFVVSLSTFKNAVLDEFADVILPVAPFTETSGTFVNAAGDWQRFNGVASAFEEARPAWKVLRVMGNLFHLEGFDYESSEEICHEAKASVENMQIKTAADFYLDVEKFKTHDVKTLTRIGGIPLYSTDALTRRAVSLQIAQPILEGEVAVIRIHPEMGARLQFVEGSIIIAKQKDGHVRLPVVFDSRVPLRGVYIAGGIKETSGLNELFGPIELQK